MFKFKALARDSGNSIVVTIPKAFVDADLVIKGKTYEFDCLQEVSDGERDS